MVRPVRPAPGTAEILVVGVYPSAFHVRWSPPPDIDPRPPAKRSRAFVGSLAVDVEPTVFWDGQTPSPSDELERWKAAVHFDPERDGTVSPGTNGPSGAGVIADYLAPLKVDASNVAFTDAVPWYFVKQGEGSQGAAMRKYDALAAQMGREPSDLPDRPNPPALGDIVGSDDRRESLRDEIVRSGAAWVVTLGQEALDALLVIGSAEGEVQTTLHPEGYGRTGRLVIGGTTAKWTPLVHPGFLRQNHDPGWTDAVEAWRNSL